MAEIIVPQFTLKSATRKVRLAEDAWNGRDPARIALAYTLDSSWRNRSGFVHGREQITAFLERKWSVESNYRLIKELWAFGGDRIAVRFMYEWQNAASDWFRSHGNENWAFDEAGLMSHRHASINDISIDESERLYHWDASGPRPDDHPGLTELGL